MYDWHTAKKQSKNSNANQIKEEIKILQKPVCSVHVYKRKNIY